MWTNKNSKSRELEIKVRNDLGITQKLLTQKQVLDLEPNLNQYSMQALYMRGNACKRSSWNSKKSSNFI